MNAKPMQTIYQGLSARQTLKSLTVKSPTQRIIRPVTLVPPIPSLQSLKLTDIDPLCYPDDFSLLLLHSKKLEELNLHFNPRMRDQGEPSINLHAIFGKCIAAGYKIRLKRMGLQNLYVMNHGELNTAVETKNLERISFINCIDLQNSKTIFFDRTWAAEAQKAPLDFPRNIKRMRGDGIDRKHAELLAQCTAIEEFISVSKTRQAYSKSNTTSSSKDSRESSNGISPPEKPVAVSLSSPSTPTAPSQQESISVASLYLAVLIKHHSHSLRIVLLHDQWQLGRTMTENFVKNCPNLEQFGFALEDNDITIMDNMIQFAPKVWAVRVLQTGPIDENDALFHSDLKLLALSTTLVKERYKNIRWMGIGNTAYKVRSGTVRIEVEAVGARIVQNAPKIRRDVKEVSWEDASHVEIFGLDVMAL